MKMQTKTKIEIVMGRHHESAIAYHYFKTYLKLFLIDLKGIDFDIEENFDDLLETFIFEVTLRKKISFFEIDKVLMKSFKFIRENLKKDCFMCVQFDQYYNYRRISIFRFEDILYYYFFLKKIWKSKKTLKEIIEETKNEDIVYPLITIHYSVL